MPPEEPHPQFGFVLDQRKCIGCHACTVACKSENDVPVGDFRTWVKYTEEGEFPQVKRSFALLYEANRGARSAGPPRPSRL